jgi:replicative DNA helicase
MTRSASHRRTDGRGRWEDGGEGERIVSVAGRVPPHDLDAEAAVLASILLERDALDKVLEFLKPQHFYSDSNRRIFEACAVLAAQNTPVDITTVASWLRSREWINQIGGPSYLAQIVDATPAVAHVAAHAKVVHDKWKLRELIGACQRIAAEGYGDVGEVDEFVDGAEASIYHLAHAKRTESATQPIAAILRTVFEQIQEQAENGQKMSGHPSGFDAYDSKTAGIHDGDLRIVAARPGMGKTSMVLNEAVNVASPRSETVALENGEKDELFTLGLGVIFFSLEMPKQQLVVRLLCSEARVDIARVRHNRLLPDDWRRLTEAAKYLASLPIWIDDTPAITLLELRAKVRRIQAEFDRAASNDQQGRRVGLVYVDYLQLMKGREGAGSREQEVSEISRGLKQMAKECKINVTALSQLNRAVETRGKGGKGAKPQLSDLRESGAIEQDADVILFIYRDEYYFPDTTKLKGIAEVNIAKQRQGETGPIYLRFTAQCTRFDNLAPGEMQFDDNGAQ